MAYSKLKSRFSDEEVERRIVEIEQGTYSGDYWTQQAEQLKLKCKVWDDYVGQVCIQVTALADEIDSHHKRANRAKVAGGSLSVVSGVGAVVAAGLGIALAIPTAGASIPISGAVVAACGIAAGVGSTAGAVTAGGATVVDGMIRRYNKKKAMKFFQCEAELRKHISDSLKELQQNATKYEELMHVTERMETSEYSNSLQSFRQENKFLQVMKYSILNESFLRKIGKFATASLEGISFLGGKQDVFTLLSKFSAMITKIGGVLSIVGTTLNAIDVAITINDLRKGSKTKVAAQLRVHVQLLERNRTEISEALRSFFMDT